jgi:acetolactate synthase-1/2/3 large subunit
MIGDTVPANGFVMADEGRYHELLCPDFVRLKEAYGLRGVRVERPDKARDAWTHAMNEKGPVLVEFALERSRKIQ